MSERPKLHDADVHGPVVVPEPATVLNVHGTPEQLRDVLSTLRHRVITHTGAQRCAEKPDNGCFWQRVVVAGAADLDTLRTVFAGQFPNN
jgi:hypothetical protein